MEKNGDTFILGQIVLVLLLICLWIVINSVIPIFLDIIRGMSKKIKDRYYTRKGQGYINKK